MVLAMGADFLQRAAAVNLSVARDVEVVADVAEAAADVLAAAVVKAQAHALGRGRAVNDGKRDDSHRPVKELKPNTPARAVATATMVLRTMPHTDFDFVFMFFCKHSVNHVFSSPTSIINFTSKKPSYDDTRRSGRDNELLQRAQNDL